MTVAPRRGTRRIWMIAASGGLLVLAFGGYLLQDRFGRKLVDLPVCMSATASALAGSLESQRGPSRPRGEPEGEIALAFELVFPARPPEGSVLVIRAAHARTGGDFLIYSGPPLAHVEVQLPVYPQHAADFRLATFLFVETPRRICIWRDKALHGLEPEGPGRWRLELLETRAGIRNGAERSIVLNPRP